MKNIILRGIIFDIYIYIFIFIYYKNFQLEERSIKMEQIFRYQSSKKFKFYR